MKRLVVVLLLVPSVLLAQKEPVGGFTRRGEHMAQDTLLPAPTRAYSLGVLGYTGGTWGPSGLEFGLLWRLGPHVSTAVGVTLAAGTFVQQNAVLFGQTRGFFTTLGFAVRQPLLELASVGSERRPSALKLETALDVAGAVNFDSPLPQGRWDGQAALLLGLAFGSGEPLGQSVGLFFGPALLMGKVTTSHGEFAFRMRMPLGRP